MLRRPTLLLLRRPLSYSATPPFPILYEDNHLLIISKPANCESQESVPALALAHLKCTQNTKYVAPLHRLDKPTTGCLALAKTSKAARRGSEAFRSGRVAKSYLCYCEGIPTPPSATLESRVTKVDGRPDISSDPGHPRASLTYATLWSGGGKSLLSVVLHTGRKHQIRLQLSRQISCPIVGDALYGPSLDAKGRTIFLHAAMLTLPHPVKAKGDVTVKAGLPSHWKRLPEAAVQAALEFLNSESGERSEPRRERCR